MSPPGLMELVLLVACGLAAGTAGAVLGTGGGVFLIPILLLAFKVPMHYAVGTSILTVVATSTAVAIGNLDRGTANMRLGMTLEIATSVGALSGGISAAFLPARVLVGVFAAVMVPTAFVMWRGRHGETDVDSTDASPESSAIDRNQSSGGSRFMDRLGAEYEDPTLHRRIAYRLRRLWAGLTISFVAGVMSGLLGIGGGVFKVPGLNVLCGVPIKAAAATSTFMIGVTAAASAFLYFGRGEVDPRYTSAVVLGVVAGSWVGAYLNWYARGVVVKRVFAVLLFCVAIEMFGRAFDLL
ncbi:MAG TPA: sulfite exporter TauE/SafE family protein [Planctomycetaceae bacterium]|nr:sulfite exporter TauE/SafE family protein [Planctomycetaceae bacterium]